MCLTIFVGSDCPLPLLPFDKKAPAFCADALWSEADAVAHYLNKPFLYAVGSYQGCGCGFSYREEDASLPDDDDIPEDVKRDWCDDHNARVQSVEQFAQYLRPALSVGSVTVNCCWYGDWAETPIATRHVTPEHFGGNDFHFVERELLVVKNRVE